LCPEQEPAQAILHIQCMGLEYLLMIKFMDLVVNSPRSAERRTSISSNSLQEDNTAGGKNEQKKLECNVMIFIKNNCRDRDCWFRSSPIVHALVLTICFLMHVH